MKERIYISLPFPYFYLQYKLTINQEGSTNGFNQAISPKGGAGNLKPRSKS